MTFRSRRLLNLGLLLLSALIVWLVYRVLQVRLRATAFFTGWFLLGLLLVLTAYNVYKKLPFLPLFASSTWLQFHIYAGWLTVLVFALHSDVGLAHALLGWLLLLLYAGVVVSGVVGLALSRWLAPRLVGRGEEVLFERIPVHLLRIRKEVEELVLQSVATTQSTSIADYYARRLRRFFVRPRHFWRHLLQSQLPRRALLAEANDQHRYMNPEERRIMEAIAQRLAAKDDLDYQYAVQASLKYWLFIHVPLAYSLLIFAALHVLLVYAFAG